jgi:uncharacterized protein (TIGR02001 family)
MSARIVLLALASMSLFLLPGRGLADEPMAEELDGAGRASGFSGSVTFATDYVFRGVSQTDEAPSVQGAFDYAHRSGFIAGLWGSNVDELISAGGVEIDLYAGWERSGERLDYGFELVYYAYPGDDPERPEADFFEGAAGLRYLLAESALRPSLSASYYVTPRHFAETGWGHYGSVALDLTLPRSFGLELEIGRQTIADGDLTPGLSWTHWRVSVTREIAGFDLELNYQDTDGLEEDRAVARLGDRTFVLLVSRSL